MKAFRPLMVLLCLFFVSTLWSQAQFSQIRMRPADVGTYPGGWASWLSAINNFGIAGGWSYMSGSNQQHPMVVPLLGPPPRWFDLNTLGGEGDASVEGISDTGVVVGHSITTAGDYHGFVWTVLTGMVDLGTLPYPSHTVSTAHAVNRNGTLIVGFSVDPVLDDMRAVVWTPSVYRGVLTWNIHELSATNLGTYTNGGANSVNNNGWIIGGVWGDSGWIGVVWKPVAGGSGWQAIHLQGTANYPTVSPQHINDNGALVATSCRLDWSNCGASFGVPSAAPGGFTFTDLPNPWGAELGPSQRDQQFG